MPKEQTMAGVLNFNEYVGGPDEVIAEQWFPSNRRTLVYNFNRNIVDWTFEVDFQTVVVDTVTFNRYTGRPNFASSRIIGSFAKQEMSDFAGGAYVPTAINTAVGTVRVTHPNGMYTGGIVPDARANVPIVVVSFTWTDASSPITNISSHRYALLQAWEPDVTIGDPVDEAGYTAFTL
jgi:hypothetical protein